MSGPPPAWLNAAAEVLAQLAGEVGFDGLSRTPVLKALLKLVDRSLIEQQRADGLRRPKEVLIAEAKTLLLSSQNGSWTVPPSAYVASLAREQDDSSPHPTEPPGPRVRDVASPGAAERIQSAQRRWLSRFFESPTEAPGIEDPADRLDWSAHLELNECLELVVDPVRGLPKPVKSLSVTHQSPPMVVLAANLRSGVTRLQVAPSSQAYAWTAGEFDEDLGEDLARLWVDGLSTTAATVFRVGAGGFASRLAGTSLSVGSAYRLLLPPSLGGTLEGLSSRALSGGWRVAEVAIAGPRPELSDALATLGLRIGPSGVEANWVLYPPTTYRVGSSGDRFACFHPDAKPCLRIEGVPPAGEVRLVLTGVRSHHVFPIAPGQDAVVQLSELAPGRYVADVLCSDLAFSPVRVPFAIEPVAAPLVPARAQVWLCGVLVDTAHGADADLSQLGEGALRIEAPPQWRIDCRWEGSSRRNLPPVFADSKGSVDVQPLLAITRENRLRDLHADLALDLGELGEVVLRHSRAPTAADLLQSLRALLSEREQLLDADLDLLFDQWVKPVCQLLGYDITTESLSRAPTNPVARVAMLATTRRRDGRIHSEVTAALVSVGPSTGLRTRGSGSALAVAVALAKEAAVGRVVLTNGRHWQLVDPKKAFQRATFDLPKLFAGDASEAGEDFLSTFYG